MADEIITPVAPVTVQPAETPAPTLAAVDSAGPSSVETPAAVPAEISQPELPLSEPPTVLGAEPVKAAEPAKTPDAPVAPVEVKKEEAPQSVEPAPLPTYEDFTFPEGFSQKGVDLSEFTKELGEFQNATKADQAEVQKFGQKLVDQYIAGIQEVVKSFDTVWEKQKSDWKSVLEKDPEIGGNRLQTITKEIVDVISSTSPKETHDSFRKYMQETGIGNNPDLIRPIHNMAKEITNLRAQIETYKKTYESESGVKPLPGVKPESTVTSKVARRYGGAN